MRRSPGRCTANPARTRGDRRRTGGVIGQGEFAGVLSNYSRANLTVFLRILRTLRLEENSNQPLPTSTRTRRGFGSNSVRLGLPSVPLPHTRAEIPCIHRQLGRFQLSPRVQEPRSGRSTVVNACVHWSYSGSKSLRDPSAPAHRALGFCRYPCRSVGASWPPCPRSLGGVHGAALSYPESGFAPRLEQTANEHIGCRGVE